MHSSKTADTLIAEMMMVRAGGWRGPFLVIEGPDDQKFWQARVRLGPEALVISEGVRNLLGCMRELPPKLTGNVCAIADTDFRAFLATDPFANCTDVFFYDEGFLETFVLNSVALRKLLGTRADPARMRAFLETSGAPTVYVHLRRVASVFGRLRVVNERHRYGFSFEHKGFTPHRYVDETTWLLNIPRLLGDFARSTGRTEIDLKTECDSISEITGLRLVHGHDVLKILTIGLKHAIGSYNTNPNALFTDLCLAFEEESLRRKPLAGRLKVWAGNRALLS